MTVSVAAAAAALCVAVHRVARSHSLVGLGDTWSRGRRF